VEAGRAFGSSELQLLRHVQLPLARPTIMAGLNQTLMLSLSMVVIVALIAGGGLGQVILRGVNRADVPIATTSGIAVLILAVVLDRISQAKRGGR
jgi:glycine betaine/proline transport system permease protein